MFGRVTVDPETTNRPPPESPASLKAIVEFSKLIVEPPAAYSPAPSPEERGPTLPLIVELMIEPVPPV